MAPLTHLVVFLSCLRAVLSHERIAEKRQSTTLTVYTLPGWQSLGCWSDSQASRTLSVAAHWGPHVSDDNCQYQCQQLGYDYAGTEYSGQCYCDNSVNPIATNESLSDCNMACTGDANQPCGGANRINLFWNGQTAAAPPPVYTNPGVDGWVFEGCYTDSVAARTLGHTVNAASAGAMTIQSCVDACKAAGYSLAGAEYADECYCDNTYTNGALASDQTTCNMVCKGNSSEYCGGAGTMNLYSYGGATPVQAAPSSSSSVAPVQATLPPDWLALNCYTDTVGKRALQNFFNAPSGGMTVETCVGLCKANGYSIAGVEYGAECYCDNSIQNNQGLAYDGNTGCNMACSGNAGETCGGPNRLDVYAAGGEWVQLGCFTDQPYSRTLAYAPSYPGSLTVETCLTTCGAAGYPYAGVEYGNECHCGYTFDNGGGPAPDGSAGCSFACAGNSSEICGGSQRLSMYVYISPSGTIATAPSTTASSTTTTTTAAAPATPQPVESGLPSGWSYSGCYVDNSGARILNAASDDVSTQTVEGCISFCTSSLASKNPSAIVAGVEYGSQCFCDTAIQNSGAQASSSVAAANCHMACSGNSSESCGGPALIDVYYTGTLTVNAPPATQTDNLPAGWTAGGCVVDNIGSRVMTGAESDLQGTNDADTCIGYCSGLGYTAAGLEYGYQCFCDSVAAFLARDPASSTGCTMACPGNSSTLCGGAGALFYYSQAS